MATFDKKFVSTKQDWTTPQWLFDILNDRYNFSFDLAASRKNSLCEGYFTKSDSALIKNWHGRCWLNPPYGGNGSNRLGLWVKKSFEETRKIDTIVTMLIPARTNTMWWHDYCMKANEIIFLKGRPKFGDAKYGLPQPLAVIHFTSISCAYFQKILSLDVKNRKIIEII